MNDLVIACSTFKISPASLFGLGDAGLGFAQAATQAPLMQAGKSPFSVLESVTPQEIATTKTRFR